MASSLKIIRTDSSNPDFHQLIVQLDAYLKISDGDEHAFYAQYNKLDHIQEVVLAYDQSEAIGCGAIKAYTEEVAEIKRMFVAEHQRGKGIASQLLKALEEWAQELGFKECLLETGVRQKAAIQLYTKNHYQVIPNYGQYAGIEDSVCMMKSFR